MKKKLTLKQKIMRSIKNIGRYIKYTYNNFFYWLRCMTIDRYHFLDLRTKDYRWGWMDQDWRMFHACFSCLVDFVEKEKGLEHMSFQVTAWKEENHLGLAEREKISLECQQNHDEVKELYDWWKKGREKEHNEVSHLTDDVDLSLKFTDSIEHPGSRILDSSHYNEHPKWLEYCKRTDELEQKDDDMLNRVIKIRHLLWT